jgi:hypothetical protein
MTRLNSETDVSREPPEGKRPWGTPQIIVSEIASQTRIATGTTPFHDTHVSSGTVNAHS